MATKSLLSCKSFYLNMFKKEEKKKNHIPGLEQFPYGGCWKPNIVSVVFQLIPQQREKTG